MSVVVTFPMPRSAIGGILASQYGGLRSAARRVLDMCASAADGGEIDPAILDDLEDAARVAAVCDANLTRRIETAARLLSAPIREANVASTADGELVDVMAFGALDMLQTARDRIEDVAAGLRDRFDELSDAS